MLQKGISQVTVPQGDGEQLLTTQEEVEPAIMANNSRRFHLTDDTPFMVEPLVNEVGYLANTPFVQAVLAGDFYSDPRLDSYTNDFLCYLSKHQCLPTISHAVSAKDFQQYWTKARERTSSSVSGRHFGHYVAASH